MEVFEKINSILIDKKITKREFSKKLRDLEPRLYSTGEVPSEKTIYKYLNGSISIKIELIPYIAEVLQITEQELFTNDLKTRRKFFQNILKTSTPEEIEILKTKFHLKCSENSFVKEPKPKYNENNSVEEELLSLLRYAPRPLLDNFLNKLKEIKEFTESF